jgi:hypothetical protein
MRILDRIGQTDSREAFERRDKAGCKNRRSIPQQANPAKRNEKLGNPALENQQYCQHNLLLSQNSVHVQQRNASRTARLG